MSDAINGSRPVHLPTAPAAFSESSSISEGQMSISEAVMMLDEMSDDAKKSQMQLRKERNKSKHKALETKMKGLRSQLALNLVGSAVSIASSAVSLASSTKGLDAKEAGQVAEAASTADSQAFFQGQEIALSQTSKKLKFGSAIVESIGKGVKQLGDFYGNKADIASQKLHGAASNYDEIAKQEEEFAANAEKRADKALDKLEQIERDQHQAMMAALRG